MTWVLIRIKLVRIPLVLLRMTLARVYISVSITENGFGFSVNDLGENDSVRVHINVIF